MWFADTHIVNCSSEVYIIHPVDPIYVRTYECGCPSTFAPVCIRALDEAISETVQDLLFNPLQNAQPGKVSSV